MVVVAVAGGGSADWGGIAAAGCSRSMFSSRGIILSWGQMSFEEAGWPQLRNKQRVVDIGPYKLAVRKGSTDLNIVNPWSLKLRSVIVCMCVCMYLCIYVSM